MKEKSLILFFYVVGGISFGLSMPVLNEQVVLAFGSKGLAIERLTELISVMIFCTAYKYAKTRELIKRYFLEVYLVAIIMTIAVVMMIIREFNPLLFLICHLVSYCMLIQYVNRAIVWIRAWFFADPAKREDFDNSKNLWSSVGGLIGFGVSSFLIVPLDMALILYIISMLVLVGWIIVYIKHRNEAPSIS